MANSEQDLFLTFADRANGNFFLEASVGSDFETSKPLRWTELIRKSVRLKAFCILMLVAKHRAEKWGLTNEEMTFKANSENDARPGLYKSNWIYTLGGFMENEGGREIFGSCFDVTQLFFNAIRGSDAERTKSNTKRPTYAVYQLHRFPFRSVRFLKRSSSSQPTEITKDVLATYACELEASEEKRWRPIVESILEETKSHDSTKSQSEKDTHPHPLLPKGVWLTTEWRDFIMFQEEAGLKIRERLKVPEPDDSWYVVTIAPVGFETWIKLGYFHNAVEKYRVPLKWVFHSESHSKDCEAIRDQWHTLFIHRDMENNMTVSKEEVINEFRKDLIDGKRQLKNLARSVQASPKKRSKRAGVIEFFESKIVHTFMAFMAVPNRKPPLKNAKKAPDGTICVVQPYPMHPVRYGARWGLYLEGTNPILDIYYTSIMNIFGNGVDNGYLTPVDSQTMEPIVVHGNPVQPPRRMSEGIW